MRQDALRTVAPTVTAPQWPAGYMTALREAGAQEKNIPYCIGWVRAFFARNPGRRRRDLGRAEIEAFLLELAGRDGVVNWQVQQARDALEVYYERFRGLVLEPRRGVATLTPAPSPSGRTAETAGAPSSDVHADPSFAVPPATPSATPPAIGTAMRVADVRTGYSGTGDGVNRLSPAVRTVAPADAAEAAQKLPAKAGTPTKGVGVPPSGGSSPGLQPRTGNAPAIMRIAGASGAEARSQMGVAGGPGASRTGIARDTRPSSDLPARGAHGPPVSTLVPERKGERPRAPLSPRMAPGSPAAVAGAPGSVNWQALEDKVRECLRVGHYSYRTEQTA